jgi:hypothetical protein
MILSGKPAGNRAISFEGCISQLLLNADLESLHLPEQKIPVTMKILSEMKCICIIVRFPFTHSHMSLYARFQYRFHDIGGHYSS